MGSIRPIITDLCRRRLFGLYWILLWQSRDSHDDILSTKVDDYHYHGPHNNDLYEGSTRVVFCVTRYCRWDCNLYIHPYYEIYDDIAGLYFDGNDIILHGIV